MLQNNGWVGMMPVSSLENRRCEAAHLGTHFPEGDTHRVGMGG